jgi:tripartite-type tricarboxylate transporter receptor subunit TctC
MKIARLSSLAAHALRLAVVGLSAAGAWLPHAAHADTYPARPVRIIVPAAPGGGIDLVARSFSAKLSEIWGQSVFVENKPGANAIVGTDATAKATPDGYTFMLGSGGAFTINPLAYRNLPYNANRDLLPVTLVSSSPSVLLVNNNVPAKTVQELVEHLRANPGKLNHATNTASTLLASEMFKALAKVDYVDINYKGGALAAASTAAGETQFCIVDMGSASPYLRSNRGVRALAVTTPERFKLLPEIPTLAESGLPGYSYTAQAVLFAPSKVPPEILAKFSADLRRVLAMPDVNARIESVGNEVVGSGIEETGRALRADSEQWAKLVKERNISFP